MANTNMMEREFGWDDIIENDGPTWVLLPEGTYPFTVTEFERKRHPGSAKLPPCWKAELTIAVEGAEGTANIQHNLFLHSKCEGLLCAFFTAIGDRKHGQPLKMGDLSGNVRRTGHRRQYLPDRGRSWLDTAEKRRS